MVLVWSNCTGQGIIARKGKRKEKKNLLRPKCQDELTPVSVASYKIFLQVPECALNLTCELKEPFIITVCQQLLKWIILFLETCPI